MSKRNWIVLIVILGLGIILGLSVLVKPPTPPDVTPTGYQPSAPTISPDGAVYQFDGCYVTPSYWASSSGCPSIASNAEGVMIRAFWDAIETSEGVYDWSTVISHSSTITGGGRDVALTLAIYAGGGSPGPTDLAPAYLKNRIGSYSLSLDDCSTIEMPKYDHPAYLAALKNLVTSAANNVGAIVDVVFIGDGYDDESWPVRPIGRCNYTSVLPFSASTYYNSFVIPLMTHYRSAFGASKPIYWFGSPTLSEQARNDVLDTATVQEVGYAPQAIWASDSRNEMTYVNDYGGSLGVMRLYEDDVPLSAGLKTNKWLASEDIWYIENKLLMFPLDIITIQKTAIDALDWTYYTNRRGSLPWNNDYSFIIAHSPERSRISAAQTWWPWHYDLEHFMYPVSRTDSPTRVYKYIPDTQTASGDWNNTIPTSYPQARLSKYSRHFWWLDSGANALYLDVDTRWKYHAQQPTDNSGLFKADINIVSLGNEITVYYKNHAGAEQSYAVSAQATNWAEDTESLTDLYLNDQYTWGGDIRLVCATPPCLVHKVEIKGSWAAGSTPTPVNAWATPKFTPNWEPGASTVTPTPTHTPTLTPTPNPGVSYYVATDGDDADPGTIGSPFLTIAQAQTAVRALISGGMTSNVTVYVRGGTYYLSSSLAFNTSDSGRDGYDVIYRNYPGETPIISGGQVIGGAWNDEGGSIYSTADVGSLEFRQLWVEGTRATRAREPDTGFYSLVSWDTSNKRVKINSSEISNWGNLTEVELIAQKHWNADVLRISSYSTSGSYAYVTAQEPEKSLSFGQSHPQRANGQSYHFENAYEFIDAEGEWYLNTSTNRLYYKLRSGESIGSIVVIAPKVEKLISIVGSSGSYVDSIHFVGLTFRHSTWTLPSSSGFVGRQAGHYRWGSIPGAIWVEFAQNLLFYDNTFERLGGSGVVFYQGTRSNVVSCNTLTDISGNGISIEMRAERDATDAEQCWYDEVYDNTISHVGKDYYGCVGIFGGYPVDADIQYNTIHDLPYTGISVGWGWTLDDVPQRDNDIGYNEIYDVMQMLDDGGGIYTLSKSPDTRIHDNYVHDLVRSSWAGSFPIAGIYLDNGSDYMIINNNTSDSVPTEIHINAYMAGTHNTFYDNNGGAAAGAGVRSPCGESAAVGLTPTPTPTTMPDAGGKVSLRLYAIDDTHINSPSPTTNTGATQQLQIAPDGSVVTLLKFDLSGVPSDVSVDSAVLELLVGHMRGTYGQSVTSYKVLRNWGEYEATWNVAKTGTNWGTAGCQNTTTDRSSTGSGTATETEGVEGWLSFDVTSLVLDWLTTPTGNHGVVLKASGSEIATLDFYSREYSQSHAPRLTLQLTYGPLLHTPTPVPTSTPTPTPNLPLSIVLEGTPYANMSSITYTIQVENAGVDPFYGQLIFDFDDSLPFVASTPPPSFETDAWVGWINQQFLGGTQTDFTCYLSGPPSTGEYTQKASGVAYDMRWSARATAVATFENTTPTAVPSATPTPTATSGPTATATPTWTPYPTPVYGVQINEVCPAPDDDHNKNGVADSLDLFVELRAYDTATDITGWKIGVQDATSWVTTWYLIPATTIVAVDDHLVIFGSQSLREDTAQQEQIPFVITSEGFGCVSLANSSGVVVDSVCYNVSDVWWDDAPSKVLRTGECCARMPDGSTVNWQKTDCTPGWANGE